MGNKVKVRARQTRGSGKDEALEALKQILCTDYDETMAEYQALDDNWKGQFDAVLGDLADPFQQGKLMVEMQMNLLEESDSAQTLEQLNKLFDEMHGNAD